MRDKRSALSQQVTTRHQQKDLHESITKQDRNNINDPQKKHRLGTVSKNILLGGLNQFNDAPTSPFVQMWIKTQMFQGSFNAFKFCVSGPMILHKTGTFSLTDSFSLSSFSFSTLISVSCFFCSPPTTTSCSCLALDRLSDLPSSSRC